MPAYHLHCVHIWLLARDARDRARAAVAKDPNVPALDAIAAIILSAAASEGFINELSELYIPKRPDHRLPSSTADFAQKIRELEKNRSTTLCKYLAAASILSGTEFDKGKKPYQDFALLFKVRDSIMHIKAVDQAGPREGEITAFTMPDLVKTFQSKKLAKPSEKTVGSSWLDALETDKMASWACETASNMMLAVLDMIPASPGDPVDEFKRQLRYYKTPQ